MSNGEKVTHETAQDLVEFLGSDLPEVSTDHDRASVLRIWVAMKFRPVVQAKSISEYPFDTVTRLDEQQRDFLYGNHSSEPIEQWLTLPPFVAVCPPENAPESTVLDGEETVWVLDTTTDMTLLTSLREYGALAWTEV